MDYEKIASAIVRSINNSPTDRVPYNDLLTLCVETQKKDNLWARKYGMVLGDLSKNALMRYKEYEATEKDLEFFSDSYSNALLLCTQTGHFDSYLRFVEIRRNPKKKFYIPRQKYLAPMVQGYQDIMDGKIHLLTLSLPKRCGKSQLGINFTCMLSGMRPDRSTLMEGTGDALVDSFYKGCLEYFTETDEYSFYDAFPTSQIVETHSDIHTINLEKKSRFPTIMCRSIEASQVGLSEATNLLYLDDCVKGRDESMNRELLDKKWEKISGDIIGRAIEGTPIVITGTRYSLYDPIGRLQDFGRQQHWKMEVIEVPALDLKTDESNYEYELEGRKFFTTKFFREQRDLLTPEQWESEFQQQPFEAKGLLFNEKELNYYFSLPTDHTPDSVVAFVDTAGKGTDSTSMVVLYLYGDDVFVEDVVHDDSTPQYTIPECAAMLVKHHVVQATFESNSAGEFFAQDVDKAQKEAGGRTSIISKPSCSKKQTRIEIASNGIISHFFFKHKSTVPVNSQYFRFMREVTTYTRSGKVPHDDAPDVLSMAENGIRHIFGEAKAVQRPF